MRLHGRSLMAFVLSPTAPITDWLTALDRRSGTSPAFFVGRPIILDLAAVALNESQIGELITQLTERGIRVMALEGTEADQLDSSLPPVIKRGRQAAGETVLPPSDKAVATARPRQRQEPSSLLIESPIRSAPSLTFSHADLPLLPSAP